MVPLLCLVLASAHAETSKEPLFWAISRDNAVQGYLLGTIHSEDPRVLDFSQPFLDALTDSRVFAMELVPNLPTLAALAERMQLPEGEDLESIVGPARFAALTESLGAYGIPPAQVRSMQPWAAMMTLSVPPPRTGLFMDFSLSLRASGAGVKVIGLETLDQQLSFLEGMGLEEQLGLLDHAIEESGRVQEMHDQMVEIYLRDDLSGLHDQAMEQLEEVPEPARSTFLEEGIEARNRRMLESALPQLDQGGVFIAVGALHLTGPLGLLQLLREQGFQLKPAGWPFVGQP